MSGCLSEADLSLVTASGADEATSSHLATCARCRERLAQLKEDDDFLGEVVEANRDRLASGKPGAIAGYEMHQLIGRGTQGQVYEATQLATRRRVALKMLTADALAPGRQRRRFEHEVEIVASLRHPSIVTVYESGVDETGRPYVAMELVDGVPIDAYVEQLRSAGAPGASDTVVLRLFEEICGAVSAAHRRGIIHRDLKPANILVDAEGHPRVLDFGIAKELEADISQTIPGAFMGTFAYAAPEQVGASSDLIDTRSDVFALGVILYEMLTGTRPRELDGGLAEIVATIRSGATIDPRRMRPDLSRDLLAILRRALAPEAARRYQSVTELAEDLRAVRTGDSVRARRHERWYGLGRVLRRYRWPLAASVVAVAGLAVVSVVMTQLYREASTQRRHMAQTLGMAVRVIGALDLENPLAPQSVTSTRELLTRVSEFVTDDLADIPSAAGPMHRSIGLAALSQDDFEMATEHLMLSLDHAQRERAAPDAVIATCLHDLGRLHFKTDRYDDAERLYREALVMRRAVFGDEHPDVVRTLHHLASTLRQLGRIDESEAMARDVLARRMALYGDDHPEVGNSLNSLGICLLERGDGDGALHCATAGLDLARRAFGDDDWRVARAWHSVGLAHAERDAMEEARDALERSLQIKRRTRGEGDLTVRRTRLQLARVHAALGDFEQAEQDWRAAGSLAERAGIEGITALEVRGRLHFAAGDDAAAERLVRRARKRRTALCGERHVRVARLDAFLASIVAKDPARGDEAAALIAQAVAILTETIGADAPLTQRVRAQGFRSVIN